MIKANAQKIAELKAISESYFKQVTYPAGVLDIIAFDKYKD